jgi:PDZ domain
MKRCGRSNSDAGFHCHFPPRLFCTQSHDRWGSIIAAAGNLAVLALVSAAAVASASSALPGRASLSIVPRPVASSKTADVDYLANDSGGQAISGTPASTAEIPPMVPGSTAGDAEPTANNSQAQGNPTSPSDYDDGIIRYEHAKDSELSGPPIGSLDDFMSGGDITSPLGFEVREDKRSLKSGGEAQGLLIIEVFAGSPAARAGLRAYHQIVRNALETAAVAGAIFFPPAVLLVPVVEQVRIGESYDLIIGVDGSRVTNFLEFQDRLRDVQAGEIVYLSVLRNGERKQIQVPVPANFAGPTF